MTNYDDFKLEQTTIWSFPNRGSWATHSSEYRGNWSPYIPKNLILRYSNECDWVLDPFVGSGTTAIEAALLNRNFIGVDINQAAIDLTITKLKNIETETKCQSHIRLGNANDLTFLKDNSIDLVCMHPPYCNIIRYSENIVGDISLLDEKDFYLQMDIVAREVYRVLKKGKYIGFLIGDMRRKGNYIPLGFHTMSIFLNVGFSLKDIAIKEQHNCRSTENWTKIKNRKFLLIQHEYLFILKK